MRTQHVVALYVLLVGGCRTVVEEVPAEPMAGSPGPRQTVVEPARAAGTARATGAVDGFGWSELRGDNIGSGESSPAQLRKSIKLSVGDDAGYTATHAYALRTSPTSDYVTVLVEVENHTSSFHCFIEAKQIELLTAAGERLPIQRDSSYVSGSLGQSELVTDTCLAEGETGYFSVSPMMGAAADAFDTLAEIAFSLSASTGTYERPDFKLVPKSYVADDDQIQLELVNEGVAKAPIEDITLIEYLLLDSEGLPLDTGFLEASTLGASVPPGGTLMANDSYYFTGSSQRMKVLASY